LSERGGKVLSGLLLIEGDLLRIILYGLGVGIGDFIILKDGVGIMGMIYTTI
jgi:hypothetical protein